jgi:hypothetical protein
MNKGKPIVGVRPTAEEDAIEFAARIKRRDDAMFEACEINLGFLKSLLAEVRYVETKEALVKAQGHFKKMFPKYYDQYSLLPDVDNDELEVAKKCLYEFLGSKNVKTKLLSRNFLT